MAELPEANTDYDVCDEKSSEINRLPNSKVSVGFTKHPAPNEDKKEESIEVAVSEKAESSKEDDNQKEDSEIIQTHTLSNQEEWEDSSDEENFENDYPVLFCMKHETDADTISNKLMDHKQSLK